MSGWSEAERDAIAQGDELRLASQRRDGTLRDPVTIWVVRLGEDLFVRSVNGRGSAWFRGTQVRHEGRISAAGVERDVTFAEADEEIADRLDEAYRTKYRRYPSSTVESVLSADARSATIKLVPRPTSS